MLFVHSRVSLWPFFRAFDAATGKAVWDLAQAHKAGVTAIAIPKNGKYFATGGGNGDVRVWDMRTRELVCHLKEHNMEVNGIVSDVFRFVWTS